MNGVIISPWGLITWPDNEWTSNLVRNEDGTYTQLDSHTPVRMAGKALDADSCLLSVD